MRLKRYKLGEILDVNRGMSLSGDYYSETGNLIRLTLGNFDLTNSGFKENTSKTDIFFTGPVKQEYILEKGDIITPLTEQTPGLLGCTARIPESGKYIQSQDVALIRCKDGLLDPSFCYYLIQSASVRKQLGAAAQQTKIRHTSPDKIKSVIVDIPEIEEQRKIGSLLDSITEKIELNKSINANLEAMAKQLYDYWFVQFDFPDENGRPYKSSGGKMVWNEKLKREIPEGWAETKLEDILKLFDSKRIPLSKAQRDEIRGKGTYPYFGATCVMDYIDKYIFDGEYILLAEDGSTSNESGNPVIQRIWGKTWVNNHAHIIRHSGLNANNYVYQLLNMIPAKRIESGSIQKKISQENLLAYNVIYPPEQLILEYEAAMCKSWELYKMNTEQILELQKQRDDLLPLLMNGQVSITD